MKRFTSRRERSVKVAEKQALSGMDRYEWYKMDVKDHRHSLIYFLENALAGVKKRKLNVIQEVRLKAICKTKLCDRFFETFRKF